MYETKNIKGYQVKIKINTTTTKLITHEKTKLTQIRQLIRYMSSLGLRWLHNKVKSSHRERSINLTTNNQLRNNGAMKNHEQYERRLGNIVKYHQVS